MPSDRQTEIQAIRQNLERLEGIGRRSYYPALSEAARDIAWLLAELSRVQQERDESREWADILTRGKSPCGHWSAHAMTESGGKLITCLHCDLDSFYAAKLKAEAERDALTQEIATRRQQIGDVAERLAGLQEGDSRSPDWYHAASIAEEWVRALLQKGQ